MSKDCELLPNKQDKTSTEISTKDEMKLNYRRWKRQQLIFHLIAVLL